MKKILLLIAFTLLLFINCTSKKRFVEASDNFSETGNETVLVQQPNILYMIGSEIISEREFKSIKANSIKSINVIKNKDKIAKYTSKKYTGIIIVTLKK